jgi:hypothetical protein
VYVDLSGLSRQESVEKCMIECFTICNILKLKLNSGRAIAQAVSRCLLAAAARVLKLGSSHVGFVVDKVALG